MEVFIVGGAGEGGHFTEVAVRDGAGERVRLTKVGS